MSGLPCNTCGTDLTPLTGGYSWCPACGTKVRHRGHENEEITLPEWADPEALADLYGTITVHRDIIRAILDEIAATKLPLSTVQVLRIVRRLQAIAGDDVDPLPAPPLSGIVKRILDREAFQDQTAKIEGAAAAIVQEAQVGSFREAFDKHTETLDLAETEAVAELGGGDPDGGHDSTLPR